MSSGSSSSIYGSRNSNIISGLASGMDTEAMIEGMVQGYQQKITQLGQDRTMLQWQQSAYQSISDKLVEFSRKYMSYNSPANLFSASFFNNAILTSANGTYADLVSATGKSSSTIVLNAVAQLAEAARYTHDASGLDTSLGKGEPVKLGEKQPLSTMSGSLTLEYGNKKVTLDFGELELFNKADGTLDTAKFQTALQDKLKEQKITTSSGDQVSADTLIDVKVDSNGTVTLSDKKGAGNNVHFSGATGDLKNLVTSADAEGTSSFTLSTTEKVVKEDATKAEYLSGKSFTVTLNGQTKTFTLGEIDPSKGNLHEQVKQNLQEGLDKAFGKGKITVDMDTTGPGERSFSFSVSNGDTFRITSPVGEVLGLGENGVTSYVDTGKTLGDLLGRTSDGAGLNGLTGGELAKAIGDVTEIKDKDGKVTSRVDSEGNTVDEQGYRLDKDGKRFPEYELTVTGVSIGKYNKDTALETVLNDINSNTEAGVSVSFSKTTNQFVFTAKETGAGGRVEIGGELGERLFGKVDVTDKDHYTAGQDAKFTATINGQKMEFSRSSNTFDLDGMSITLNGTFEVKDGETPVTFSSKTDTDKIIDVVKTMVEDYNAIVSEVKKAYSDMPLEKSNGSRYKPLTDEDKADMTESEIKAYEEKAKTGILFMDRDLSSLYSALRSAVAPGGSDGSFLRSIGIKTSYEDGLTTLSLDENALREALEQNPDQVKDAFTKSKENGAASDGLMASIQKVTDRYAATTGATKGILIEKAGSKYSPSAALNNTLLEQMKDIDKQVDKWQAKMSDKVDYYTNKFTQLEMLIAQMNSQSSSLAGMMGGY